MVKYLVIALIAALSFGAWQVHRTNYFKNESARHLENYDQIRLENDKVTLYLDREQLKSKLLQDSLTKANLALLNVKPERIIEYVEIEVEAKDTTKVEADVKPDNTSPVDSIYAFTASYEGGCFTVEGLIDTKPAIPKVTITNQTYNDVLSYILYEQRNKVKWLPFHPRWGKKKQQLEILSECGETRYERNLRVKKGEPGI